MIGLGSMTVPDAVRALGEGCRWAVLVWLAPAEAVERASSRCTGTDGAAGAADRPSPAARADAATLVGSGGTGGDAAPGAGPNRAGRHG